MHRFLIPKYVWNTAKLKQKAKSLAKQYGGVNPYEHFSQEISYGDLPEYSLKTTNGFHSLSYFSYDRALKYYSHGTDHVTSQLILALVQFQDIGEINSEEDFLETAEKIFAQAKLVNGLPNLYHDITFPKFDIDGSYISGLSQAKASSLALRLYVMTKNEKWLSLSQDYLLTCTVPQSSGGILIQSTEVHTWVEEYNSPQPSMVLLGFVFVLIAAAEYLATAKNDKITKLWEDGIQTLLAWLPHYIVDDQMLYSMYNWDIANVHYQGVGLYALEHLYECSQVQELQEYIQFLKDRTDLDMFQKLLGS